MDQEKHMGDEVPGQERPAGDTIRADISGPVSGQVAVGKEIRQAQAIVGAAGAVTEAELEELRELLTGLRQQVSQEAPPEKKEAALERVNELEEAVVAEKPDLSTMEYVRNWFLKHLPGVAGSVIGLVVHPIVGKLVGAAGDAVAGEFRRRFGLEEKKT